MTIQFVCDSQLSPAVVFVWPCQINKLGQSKADFFFNAQLFHRPE